MSKEMIHALNDYHNHDPCDDDKMFILSAASCICIQVLQCYVSMVALKLLLLAGDVETNPGPTGKQLYNMKIRYSLNSNS